MTLAYSPRKGLGLQFNMSIMNDAYYHPFLAELLSQSIVETSSDPKLNRSNKYRSHRI